MDYALLRAQNLPIGTGGVEATCKTLVTQCIKRTGQHCTRDGGQTILTFRALSQSDSFDAVWKMVSAEYRHHISFPEYVLSILVNKCISLSGSVRVTHFPSMHRTHHARIETSHHVMNRRRDRLVGGSRQTGECLFQRARLALRVAR